VMLISDSRSAIPVQNNRNGMRAAVAGMGYAGQVSLLNVSVTSDIAVGDILVTSGLGGNFPFGYPVGEVASIQKSPGERFAVIMVRPSAHLDKSRQVILLWPPEESPSSAATPPTHKSPATAAVKETKKRVKK
jgi:rod shape-determining protein MreC